MNAPDIGNALGHSWHTAAAHGCARAGHLATGCIVSADNIVPLLEAVIEPGDRVCIEGNNQKQADFLARSLVKTDPSQQCTTCTWCSRCWRCPSTST